MQRHQGSVASFAHRGVDYRFFVDDPHDSIQAHHHVGSLYEVEELALLARHVPQGARILDVGANIGNHAAFFEKALRAKRIVVIELQERVIEVLKLNVALNSLRAVDLSFLGVGLGAGHAHVRMEIPQAFNVAGAQFTPDAGGRYTVVKGDDLLRGEEFDFVKIDVEGMECEVIAGLSALLTRCRPILFVEVWNENRARFNELTVGLGYEVVDEYRRYDVATNLLLTPNRTRAGAE